MDTTAKNSRQTLFLLLVDGFAFLFFFFDVYWEAETQLVCARDQVFKSLCVQLPVLLLLLTESLWFEV